jgi:C1A family cysteine protease
MFPRISTRGKKEAQLRKQVFSKNYEEVEKFNREAAEGKHSYTIGLNAFSDWTEEEKNSILRKNDVPEPTEKHYRTAGAPYGGPLPDFVDWRDKGKVTGVRAQGGCASCWAFGATAAIETMLLIKYNQTVDLSEQHLMDCTDGKYGRDYPTCDYGGWPAWAYQYIIDNGGYALEEHYPYLEQTQECKKDDSWKHGSISGFVDIKPGDEEEMKRVVATVGAISVDIDASGSMGSYFDGVYQRKNCGTQRGNHIVTIIGYGTEKGRDYWLVKNSWGDWWGQNGIGKIARGVNMCAIAMHANYPVKE